MDDISLASIGTGMDYTVTMHGDNTTEELYIWSEEDSISTIIQQAPKADRDTVARCRTIDFRTNNVTALEEALNHFEAAKNPS